MALTERVEELATSTVRYDDVHQRWVDRLDLRAVRALTVIGFGVPTLVYLWLVAHFSVNVVESDQWDDVTVIRSSYSHLFSWGALWAQHNENRIFFPNLIVLALSRLTHFNVQIEEFLSAAMLLAAVALVILTHRRRSFSTPWLYYCPVAVLMLTLAQYGNSLWGFQMAWYLVLLAMALTLYLVDRDRLTWLAFAAAATAAIIGSFSSLQGLLIWPVGLLLLYHRRRAWPFMATWVVLAAATTALYMHNFNSNSAASGHGEALTHPWLSLKFFLFAIGDVLGVPFKFLQIGGGWIVLFGAVIVALALVTLVLYGIRRDDRTGAPIGVALTCMGLLFAATVTQGRIIFGFGAASASRYTTFDILVLTGIYLTLLDRPGLGPGRENGDPNPASGSGVRTSAVSAVSQWFGRIGLPVARIAVIVLIVVQVAFSVPNGLRGSQSSLAYQTQGAQVLQNIDHENNARVVYYLYVFSYAEFIRRQAATLKEHHLNVFADGSSWP